jgi:hypothetical protein
MTDALGILLRFILDKNAQRQAVTGILQVDDALEKTHDTSDELTRAFEQDLSRAMDDIREKSQELQSEFNQLNETGERLGRISTVLSVAGAGLVGGILLAAKSHVDQLEETGEAGTQAVEDWLEATERLKASQRSFGRVALQAALPLLERAAVLAEKAASFIEKNPEIVQAALNTGLVVATLGAVGTAVSQGIKLIADIGFLAAKAQETINAAIVKKASETNLKAALLSQKSASNLIGGFTDPKALIANLGKGLGAAVVLAVAAFAGSQGGIALGNAINRQIQGEDFREQDASDALRTVKQIFASDVGILLLGLEKIGVVSRDTSSEVFESTKKLLGLNKEIEDLGTTSEKSEETIKNFRQTKEVFEDFLDADLEATEQYNKDRERVISTAATRTESANKRFKDAIERASETLSDSLSRINRRFSEASKDAAEDSARRRADIVRQGGEDIEDIEKDHQSELVRLRRDHNRTTTDLIAKRDALGLIREKERFNDQVREAEEGANELVAQRREDIAQQLRDESRAYQVARSRRLRQYRQDIKDAEERNKAQVALAKKQQEEALALAEKEKSDRLRELKDRYREERIERLNAAFDQISDLSGNLTAERLLKQKFYDAMLTDSEKFMSAFYRQMTTPIVALTGANAAPVPISGNIQGATTPTSSTASAAAARAFREQSRRTTRAGAARNTNVNLELPGGIVTVEVLGDILTENNDNIGSQIEEILR